MSIDFMTYGAHTQKTHTHTQQELIFSAAKNEYPFRFIYIVTIWLKSVKNEQNLSQRRT